MWAHVQAYVDGLSSFAVSALVVIYIVAAWKLCGWIARRIEQWQARDARPARRQPPAPLGRTLESQIRSDLSQRLARRVDERGDPAGTVTTDRWPGRTYQPFSAGDGRTTRRVEYSESCFETTSVTRLPSDAT